MPSARRGGSSRRATADLDDLGQLALGPDFTCATRRSDGAVRCWGRDAEGQLGDGSILPSASHELNTPLTSLRFVTQSMLSRAAGMANLVQHMLDVSCLQVRRTPRSRAACRAPPTYQLTLSTPRRFLFLPAETCGTNRARRTNGGAGAPSALDPRRLS
jgi:hypothetical protein